MTATLKVIFAGPYISFQDAGRPGNLRWGVPCSGPMDRLAHAAAHASVANPLDATAIEVSRGGLILECVSGSITVAVTGGDFTESWNARSLRPGDRLAVHPQQHGSWAYVAFAGVINAAEWLGHSATHSRSGFGGGALRTGDTISVREADVRPDREGEIPQLVIDDAPDEIRVVLGPQDHHFDPAAVEVFSSTTYHLSDAYDRMGVRLEGAELPLREALSIPSEPIIRGSVQVGGDHVPTVLLADHQTTGGYPKIATIITPDLDRFAQKRSGEPVQFMPISSTEAIAASREYHNAVEAYLALVASPGRTLSHRLMQENLIGLAPPPEV